MTYEIKVDALCRFSLRCVWIGFALNGITVPFISTKKIDTNQKIRYEKVPLSKMGSFNGNTHSCNALDLCTGPLSS